MNVGEIVIERIEGAGGLLVADGDQIRIRVPEHAEYLIEELREHKQEVLSLLKEREEISAMPPGVRLVRWEVKTAPIVLTRFSVVTDVTKFISATLSELKAALDGKKWLAGNWSVGELVDRLEQCGVHVQIEAEKRGR